MNRASLSLVLALAAAPAFADTTPAPTPAPAPAPAAIAAVSLTGAKVTAFDATKHSLTVTSNAKSVTLDTTKAQVTGTIAVGKMVDVTYVGMAASVVTVKP